MNTEEKVLSGFLGLLAVAGIVVIIVLLVKKNGGEKFEATADNTPCGAVTGWPVCGGVCPNNKHCRPWGTNTGVHGCDCM